MSRGKTQINEEKKVFVNSIVKWIGEHSGAMPSYSNFGVSGLPDIHSFINTFQLSNMCKNSEIKIRIYKHKIEPIVVNYKNCLSCGIRIVFNQKDVRHCATCRRVLYKDEEVYSLPMWAEKLFIALDENDIGGKTYRYERHDNLFVELDKIYLEGKISKYDK